MKIIKNAKLQWPFFNNDRNLSLCLQQFSNTFLFTKSWKIFKKKVFNVKCIFWLDKLDRFFVFQNSGCGCKWKCSKLWHKKWVRKVFYQTFKRLSMSLFELDTHWDTIMWFGLEFGWTWLLRKIQTLKNWVCLNLLPKSIT